MAIYLIRRDDGSNLVKIGHSGNVHARLTELRRTALYGITLLWDSGTDHGPATECLLHKLFMCWQREGEWFDFGDVDPVTAVRAALPLAELLVRDPRLMNECPLMSHTTQAAARELGVDRATLWRWKQAGIVEPQWQTAGGQARWDIDDLRRQLRENDGLVQAMSRTKKRRRVEEAY